MLISAGLDNRVLQWDLAAYPSVLTDLGVDSIGSELSAMSFLHDWALLATGECGIAGLMRFCCSIKSKLQPACQQYGEADAK